MTTNQPSELAGGPSGAPRCVVGYLRVSTDRQAEEGYGLEVQEAAVRAWAQEQGAELVALHRDEGVSGSNGLESRRGLFDALEDLRTARVGGLVVYRLDRLARDQIIQEQLFRDIRLMGAELYSANPSEAGYLTDDPEDPSRTLIRQILGSVSQYERAMIRLRMRQGKAAKKAAGGFGGGQVPLGYKTVGGELVADEDEAATLARIAELKAEGLSLRAMAARLTEEGHRPKQSPSGRWHAGSLSLIVRRLEVVATERT